MRPLLLLFGLFISGCQHDKHHVFKAANGTVLIDDCLFKDVQPYTRIDLGTYLPVYYVGKQKDTIRLPFIPVSMWKADTEDFSYVKRYEVPDSNKLQILVDTSLLTYHTHTPTRLTYSHHGGLITSGFESYEAYHVFIYNFSNSFVNMGSANAVGWISTETKDQTGKWITALGNINYGCGTSIRDLTLKPGDMLAAKYIKRSGGTYKQLRLKYEPKWPGAKPVYSNEFWGYIDFQKEED